MRLSNSKVKTYRRCPRQFKYKYVDKLEPKQKAVQLERGTWIHSCLEEHYEGGDWREPLKKLTVEFNNLFVEEREELGDLPAEVARIMKSYMVKWKKEDSRFTVIDTELDEILPLPNGDEFNFIIDLIIEDEDGGLWLWDHKTGKSFLDADFMLVDAQLARYFWAAEYMGYTPLRGVVFNEIRTKAPVVPDVLQSGRLSERKNMDTDYYTYLRAIKKLGQDPAEYEDTLLRLRRNSGKFFRRTKLPKDAPLTEQLMGELSQSAEDMKTAVAEERFPRAPDKSCVWGCSYKDICIAELFGADPQHLIKANFQRRSRGE